MRRLLRARPSENFIKLHKTQLPRTDLLPQPRANQFRLILHTALLAAAHPAAAAPKRSAGKRRVRDVAASLDQARAASSRARAHPRLVATACPTRDLRFSPALCRRGP